MFGVLGYGGAMPEFLFFIRDMICGPSLVTFLFKTPTIECYMVFIVVEIELRARNIDTILYLTMNVTIGSMQSLFSMTTLMTTCNFCISTLILRFEMTKIV